MSIFEERKQAVLQSYESLILRKNGPEKLSNGIYERWRYPVITADHAPVHWKYDLNEATNPYFLERLGVNAAFNPGAIQLNGKSGGPLHGNEQGAHARRR